MKLEQRILDYALTGDSNLVDSESFDRTDIEAIKVITQISERDLPIEKLERLEIVLKEVLSSAMYAEMSGEQARSLANYCKDLGLMLKYKPYAVKASSPLGYSIFLQRPKEGFSFQNHLTHKTEVFHILEVMDGGYVFLCHYDDWKKHYDEATFEAWLKGKSHPFFDRCRYEPTPGDVFVISELGIVHTVIGCILEEFATASTDMVQRLHDQNDRNAVPDFPRHETEQKLVGLSLPKSSRVVDMLSGAEITKEELPIEQTSYGERVVLTDSFVRAAHHHIHPGKATPTDCDSERALFLRVFGGKCDLTIQDAMEVERKSPTDSVSLSPGDSVVIPPGMYFAIANTSGEQLAISEHRIAPDVAFV